MTDKHKKYCIAHNHVYVDYVNIQKSFIINDLQDILKSQESLKSGMEVPVNQHERHCRFYKNTHRNTIHYTTNNRIFSCQKNKNSW